MPSWYRLRDMPPPYTVHVWVDWCGREFLASRGRHPKTGRDVWVAIKAGGQMELITRIGDLREPENWRPQNQDTWAGSLPPPITPVIRERNYTEKSRFQAVSEAVDDDVDRADETPGFHGKQQGRPWFYDQSRIRYRPAGEVTQRDCEGRLMRALTFCGAGKRRGCHVELSAKALAAIADAIGRGWRPDSDDDERLRLRMLPADYDDFPVAMRWFALLNPPEFWRSGRESWEFNRPQRVMLARSLPMPPSYGDIAAEFGVAGGARGARAVYDKAVRQCHAAANGKRVHSSAVVDQIEALRERNRAFRRGGA